jgi:hypothetical protein
MRRTVIHLPAAVFASSAFLFTSLMGVEAAKAQATGYVTGFAGIQPFDSTSAKLLGYLHVIDVAGVAAVSADGSTLYVPLEKGNPILLGTFSTSGELIAKIRGVGYSLIRTKVVLSPDGGTAYVMCDDLDIGPSLVGIVNLASQLVVGYIYADGGALADIAVSPNGKQLFVSVAPGPLGASARFSRPLTTLPVYDCQGENTICAFSTSTFALQNQITGLYGNLSVSQDGSSLYVVTTSNQLALYAVNTSTFRQSAISLSGFFPRVLVIAPSGNQAVAVGATTTSTFAEMLLDTQTNTMVGALQTPPTPAGTEAGTGSNISTFSPDGSSLWTVLCTGENCTQMIVGQSFPSGNLIGEATLPRIQGFLGISF